MSYPTYYIEQDDTLVHLFDTFDGGTGASITMSGFAVGDILIYKDGGVTQRSSTSGFTLLDTDGIDFDTLTGIHGFSLDLSDNTDAGFYAVGPWYHVVISSITVDAQTVSFVACAFRIVSATRGMAGTALPDAAADAAGGLPISDAGGLDLDAQKTSVDNIETDTNSLNDTKVPDTISLANINAEVDTALTDINLDHLLAAAVTGTDVVDNSVIAKLVSSGATADWDTFVNTTDALQAIRDHIGDGTNLTEAGGDGDHLTEAGGTGDHLTALPLNDLSAAQVNAEVDTAIETYGLDHLLAAAVTGTDVTDDSIIAKIVSSGATADWDTFVNTTDALQAIRDHVGDGTNLTEAGGDGDHLTEAGGTGDHLSALPLNDLSAAQVNAEVLDVLNTDTFAEPTGVPGATVALATKIGYLYMALRNQLDVTATKKTYYDDGGAAEWEKDLSDDGTTYSESEANAI